MQERGFVVAGNLKKFVNPRFIKTIDLALMKPLLARLSGRAFAPDMRDAVLGSAMKPNDHRQDHVRAVAEASLKRLGFWRMMALLGALLLLWFVLQGPSDPTLVNIRRW